MLKYLPSLLLLAGAGIFAWYIWLAVRHEMTPTYFGGMASIKRSEKPISYWSAVIVSALAFCAVVVLLVGVTIHMYREG